jgi:hypothetical protein
MARPTLALIPAVIALLTIDSRANAQQTFPIPSDFGQLTTLSISGAGTLTGDKLNSLLDNPSGRGSVLFTPTNSFSLYTTYNATGGSTNIPVESFRVEQIIFPDLSNRSFVIGLTGRFTTAVGR